MLRSIFDERSIFRAGGDEFAIIAKGFTGPEQAVVDAFAAYGNVHLAGDARLGSTLVATAIADGMDAAGRVADALKLKK